MSVLDILTSDGLLVRIKGSVSFRVRDPDRALKNIGHYEALDSGLTQREKGKIRELLFGTILKRCNDTLASLLTGSDLLTSGGLGYERRCSSAAMTELVTASRLPIRLWARRSSKPARGAQLMLTRKKPRRRCTASKRKRRWSLENSSRVRCG